jgi:ribosomal protein L11 methyltransferase
MEQYIEYRFEVQGTKREMLIASLAATGCNAFEEQEEYLLAFYPESEDNEDMLRSVATDYEQQYERRSIPPQNWNASWESSFEPVVVPGFCTVRASFHEPVKDTPYEIVITPKMSFGTGHHATTRLMMQAMAEIDFKKKSVFDFGTGTGILGILASMLGANRVLAIDNDAWSVENAQENVAANGQPVEVAEGSIENIGTAAFDCILANINRHILLQYMEAMAAALHSGGILLLSGILAVDEEIIREAATAAGFSFERKLREKDWIAMQFFR